MGSEAEVRVNRNRDRVGRSESPLPKRCCSMLNIPAWPDPVHTFEENVAAAEQALDPLRRRSRSPHLIAGAPAAVRGVGGDVRQRVAHRRRPPGRRRRRRTQRTSAPPPPPPTRPSSLGRPHPVKQRKAVLHKVADLIVERQHEIAVTECVDTGQTMRFMGAAALRGADNFRFFADQAPSARTTGCRYRPRTSSTTRPAIPIGPVGVITPWNTPFMLSTWKIAPATRGRVHGRAQAGRMVALHRPPAGRDRPRGRAAAPVCSTSVHGMGEIGRQGAHRASADQGDRLRRRVVDRIRHPGPGRPHPQARPLRTRRQEPGDRVRRRRPRTGRRRRGLHDLQPQR